MASASSGGQPVSCAAIADQIDFGFGRTFSTTDKAFILGYIRTKRFMDSNSPINPIDTLDCVGAERVKNSAVQQVLINALYNNSDIANEKISPTAIAIYLQRSKFPEFIASLGADYAGFSSATDAQRDSWLHDLETNFFAANVTVDDSARLFGPATGPNTHSGREMANLLLAPPASLQYLGCVSFDNLKDGYRMLIAALPKKPQASGATAFALNEVRGLFLDVAPGDRPLVTRVATTRQAEIVKTFAGKTCYVDAPAIANP